MQRRLFPDRGGWDYLRAAIRREFAQRHRGALLGRAWAVLQPLAMIAIYTLVFGRMMKARLPHASDDPWAYSIFLCAGLLPWSFFAETLGRAQAGFFEQAHFFRKTPMALSVPALIGLAAATLNFALILAPFAAFLLATGRAPGLVAFWALPALALQCCLALGWGMALGVVSVFFRDAQHLLQMILQFGFWFTPIVYPLEALPEVVRTALPWANPMAGIVQWYQALLLGQTAPAPGLLLPALVWTLAGLLLAWRLIERRGAEMVDML